MNAASFAAGLTAGLDSADDEFGVDQQLLDEGDEDLQSGHTLGGPNSRTDLLIRQQHNVKNGGRAALRVCQ
jgi:hypothetical protein